MKSIVLVSIIALMFNICIEANPVVLRRRAMYQHGGMRMPSITQLDADYENGILTMNIRKYSGAALLYIYDADGSIIGENAANIISYGSVMTDITPLKKGDYTLRIVLGDTIYEGTFNIP